MSNRHPVEDAEEEEDVELGLKHAGRKIWLIKVPQFVAKEWREACRDVDTNIDDDEKARSSSGDGGTSIDSDQKDRLGPVLGTLTIESGGSSAITLRLDESFAPTAHVPQEYDMLLQQQQKQQMIVAFKDHGKGRQRSVDGIVQHRLDVNPMSLTNVASKEMYSKLSRERFGEGTSQGEAREKKRTIKMMQDSKIVDIRKPVGLSVDQAFGKRRKGKDTLLLEKRVAMDSKDLMALLFRLFQRQARWSFSQLQKETDQPTQHLKKTLQEIAKQNKSGPYKDLWELSKESLVHV